MLGRSVPRIGLLQRLDFHGQHRARMIFRDVLGEAWCGRSRVRALAADTFARAVAAADKASARLTAAIIPSRTFSRLTRTRSLLNPRLIRRPVSSPRPARRPNSHCQYAERSRLPMKQLPVPLGRPLCRLGQADINCRELPSKILQQRLRQRHHHRGRINRIDRAESGIGQSAVVVERDSQSGVARGKHFALASRNSNRRTSPRW